MPIDAAKVSRRVLVFSLPGVLGGCMTTSPPSSAVVATAPTPTPAPPTVPGPAITPNMYAAVTGEPFPIPAVDLRRIKPDFLRHEVAYQTTEGPGTIIIDPNKRFLYFTEGDGRAIRYGVGVGREGFGWSGTAEIRFKQEWPKWFPPPEMIERQPELRPYADGMPGGPGNPIGCRAMYLWQGNKDTLFRIHGTNEPQTIGSHVSSGCIRMINQDAIDLYNRVPIGTKVIVLPSAGSTQLSLAKT